MPEYFQLSIRKGPNPGQSFLIEKGEVTIGRDLNADLSIVDPEVSRRHARLSLQGGAYVIEDLGSTNGTFVNGQRLAGPRLLHPGDTIQCGENVLMAFEAVQFDPDATMASGHPPIRLPAQPPPAQPQPDPAAFNPPPPAPQPRPEPPPPDPAVAAPPPAARPVPPPPDPAPFNIPAQPAPPAYTPPPPAYTPPPPAEPQWNYAEPAQTVPEQPAYNQSAYEAAAYEPAPYAPAAYEPAGYQPQPEVSTPAPAQRKWLPFVLAGCGCLTVACLGGLLVIWYIDANFLWCNILPFLPACP